MIVSKNRIGHVCSLNVPYILQYVASFIVVYLLQVCNDTSMFVALYIREVYFLLKVFFFLKFFFQLFERKASQMMENSSFNLRSQKLYFLLSIQIIFIFFFRTSFNLRSKNVCFLLSIHEIFICSLSICKAKIFICFFQYLIFISFFQSQKSF